MPKKILEKKSWGEERVWGVVVEAEKLRRKAKGVGSPQPH